MGVEKLNKKTTSIKNQIQNNWGWIAALLACCSVGFWFGGKYTEMKFNAKKLKNILRLNLQNLILYYCCFLIIRIN